MRTIRASTIALAIIACAQIAAAQQQKPTPQPTQAQLQQQIDELKKRLDETQQTAMSAKLANEYAQRTEDDAKAYYEKVLATEARPLWVMGIFITVLLALAARIGFTTFERLTQSAIREASAQLRSEYTQALTTEVQTIRTQNTDQLAALERDLRQQITKEVGRLEDRSEHAFYNTQGFTLAQAGRHQEARTSFRTALQVYAERRESFKSQHATDITNVFAAIQAASPENFAQEASKELADPIYKTLEAELNAAAIDIPELADLLRKQRR